MKPSRHEPYRIWTVAEAKARLSEIMRLSGREGQQYIGGRNPFAPIPAGVRETGKAPSKPMGEWLVDNLPRGIDLEIPSRREPVGGTPFLSDG